VQSQLAYQTLSLKPAAQKNRYLVSKIDFLDRRDSFSDCWILHQRIPSNLWGKPVLTVPRWSPPNDWLRRSSRLNLFVFNSSNSFNHSLSFWSRFMCLSQWLRSLYLESRHFLERDIWWFSSCYFFWARNLRVSAVQLLRATSDKTTELSAENNIRRTHDDPSLGSWNSYYLSFGWWKVEQHLVSN